MTAHPSVAGPFLVLLVLAHLQAVAVAWGLALAAARLRTAARQRPGGGRGCLALAFAAFGLAALAETLDHTTTRWLYVNHSSGWNGLFFAALAAGIALLAAAVSTNRGLRTLLLALVLAGVAGYAAFGKGAAIASQSLLLLVMLHLWWRRFQDPLLWLYPLFTVGLTTLFGALLNASGDQLWHLFIGPAGSLSLLVLYAILRRGSAPLPPSTRAAWAPSLVLRDGRAASAQDADTAALLWPQSRHLGLSLADCACLSLALRLNLPVLTCDRLGAELTLPLLIELLR